VGNHPQKSNLAREIGRFAEDFPSSANLSFAEIKMIFALDFRRLQKSIDAMINLAMLGLIYFWK
jgi:hypothetical protein